MSLLINRIDKEAYNPPLKVICPHSKIQYPLLHNQKSPIVSFHFVPFQKSHVLISLFPFHFIPRPKISLFHCTSFHSKNTMSSFPTYGFCFLKNIMSSFTIYGFCFYKNLMSRLYAPSGAIQPNKFGQVLGWSNCKMLP